MYAVEPTKDVCISVQWLTTMGFSIRLIPVLVKTSAINTLIQSSKKSKRVNISRDGLVMNVFVTIGLVAVFMAVWTIMDPPTRIETLTLHRHNETIVQIDLRCGSDVEYWMLTTIAREVLLLVMVAVLAVQSKNILKEFNESRALGLMVS